jgi:hypothetical protein
MRYKNIIFQWKQTLDGKYFLMIKDANSLNRFDYSFKAWVKTENGIVFAYQTIEGKYFLTD